MAQPLPPDHTDRLAPCATARVVAGLPDAIDAVAARAPSSHRFLRRQWFAAALAAYGGRARTLVVDAGGSPALALPFVTYGPAVLGLAAVPGCYWPFRGFPMAADADAGVIDAALATLAGVVRVLRIGPVIDGDPVAAGLIAHARATGWRAVDRLLGSSFVLDITGAENGWPRNSTLRKNRYHEKHLAAEGPLAWTFRDDADWPAAFDDLAAVEWASWVAARTDGRDAKFTLAGHGRFWRAAAADPVLRGMFRAAVLEVAGRPAAFSFDLAAGPLRYAIANSYDPAFARYSPGKLLAYRNLVAARAEGVTHVDWGMGDSGYKRTMGAVEGSALRDWLLLPPGVPARLTAAARLALRLF